jgi:hypothetical protein
MPVRYSAPKSKRRNPSGEQGDGAGRLSFCWHDRKLAAHVPIQNNSGLPVDLGGPLVAGWACAIDCGGRKGNEAARVHHAARRRGGCLARRDVICSTSASKLCDCKMLQSARYRLSK